MTSEGSGPQAARRPVRRVVHGVAIDDDYAWLRAENWREVVRRPRLLPRPIKDHLEAENAFAAAWFEPYARLERRLVREMRARIKEDDATVPAADGAYAYFVRFREGGEHPIVCRSTNDGEDAPIDLLDGDALARGRSFFKLGGWAQAPDHALLAWSADTAGSELMTIRVRDVATGLDLEDAVPETSGAAVWSADGAGFFYVRLDADLRPRDVRHHRLGEPTTADRVVYEEPDPGFFLSISRTQSGAFLVIDSHDHRTSETRLVDLARPGAPHLVAPRTVGVEYAVEHLGDDLVILTNDGAEDFKLVAAPLATSGREHWRDLVPHRPGRYIVDHAVFRRWIVRLEREEALPRIVVRDAASGEEHAVAFDEEAYALAIQPGFEFDTETLRFTYSSLTTPAETFDYDLRRRERTLRKRQAVPSGHDPDAYVTRRVYASAPDGAAVPISLVMREDALREGPAPLYLYGYGAYGVALSPSFRSNALSLVDRGCIYAIAHVRGGSEKGRRWYDDGKLAKKTNTFFDFIAAAEHLVEAGFADPRRIVAHGGSAGGLLIGAVANLRPDLFAGLVAEVPFVDVLATMLDASLPLTPPEWPEWGDPITSAEAFATIRAYSPYDNVAARPYPAVLALAGLTDPRVTYWEPAKWVAKLRAHSTSGRPILLHTNMRAGHGGASGRFRALRETAKVYAFALAILGRDEARPPRRRVRLRASARAPMS